MRKQALKIAAGAIALFGVITLFLSSSILFDWFGIREREGNYVNFIVWANFISAFLYFLAAYGFFRKKAWTTPVLFISALILFMAFIGLIFHIAGGGLYETKTIGAILFRTAVTIAFAFFAYFRISKVKKPIQAL